MNLPASLFRERCGQWQELLNILLIEVRDLGSTERLNKNCSRIVDYSVAQLTHFLERSDYEQVAGKRLERFVVRFSQHLCFRGRRRLERRGDRGREAGPYRSG